MKVMYLAGAQLVDDTGEFVIGGTGGQAGAGEEGGGNGRYRARMTCTCNGPNQKKSLDEYRFILYTPNPVGHDTSMQSYKPS